jgi:hypothetical protein
MSDTTMEHQRRPTAASAPAGAARAPGAPGVPPGPERPARRLGWLLAVILTGQFMAILDVSIVNVAAPTIRTDLSASGAGLQLIVAGYTIAYAVLLVTGARAGDRAGHRRAFLAGLTLFTVASTRPSSRAASSSARSSAARSSAPTSSARAGARSSSSTCP